MAEEQDNLKPIPPDIEHPEEIIDEMVSTLDDLHERATKSAVNIGFQKEKIESLRPMWQALADSPATDPEQAEIFVSGVHALAAHRDALNDLRFRAEPFYDELDDIRFASDSTAVITSASYLAVSLGSTVVGPEPPTLPDSEDYELIAQKATQIDPDLADSYRAIRELLYGTRSDPERSAMYLMRQSYDHLFSVLAPDDKVRASDFFRRKRTGKKDAVTRQERLDYAAHTYIRDETHRRALIASSAHSQVVYKRLNRAHKKGKLDAPTAKAALREMQDLLEQWIRAVPAPLGTQSA